MKLNKTVIIWLVIMIAVLILGSQIALYFRVAKVPVLIKDVPAGTQITKDMIELIEVNPGMPFMDHSVKNINELFRDGNPDTNNGKYSLVPLFKGQVIDERALTDTLTDTRFGIGAEIEDANHVAISVLLPIQNAVGVNVQAGQKVNLTYALSAGTAGLGQTINVDKNTLSEIKNVTVLDVRSENGVKVTTGSVPNGKNVMLILSIPSNKAPDISLAAAGQGIIYIALPSLESQQNNTTIQTEIPVTPVTPDDEMIIPNNENNEIESNNTTETN